MVVQYTTIKADEAEARTDHRKQKLRFEIVIMNHQGTAETGWFLSNKYNLS